MIVAKLLAASAGGEDGCDSERMKAGANENERRNTRLIAAARLFRRSPCHCEQSNQGALEQPSRFCVGLRDTNVKPPVFAMR